MSDTEITPPARPRAMAAAADPLRRLDELLEFMRNRGAAYELHREHPSRTEYHAIKTELREAIADVRFRLSLPNWPGSKNGT